MQCDPPGLAEHVVLALLHLPPPSAPLYHHTQHRPGVCYRLQEQYYYLYQGYTVYLEPCIPRVAPRLHIHLQALPPCQAGRTSHPPGGDPVYVPRSSPSCEGSPCRATQIMPALGTSPTPVNHGNSDHTTLVLQLSTAATGKPFLPVSCANCCEKSLS